MFDDVRELLLTDVHLPIVVKEPQVVLQNVQRARVGIMDQRLAQTLEPCAEIVLA